MTERCGAPKGDGEPCGSAVGLCADCGHCFAHCEHRKEAVQAARSKGGKVVARRKEEAHAAVKAKQYRTPDLGEIPAPPETAVDAMRYLSWILDATARGELGPTVARDMSTVADRFVKAVRVADHETRLKSLEEALKGVE